MTNQELLDMFIQERINMLIDVFQKNQPDKSEQEEERILQAEIFIENLPYKKKQLIENYIDSLISQLALEEAFLYQHSQCIRLQFGLASNLLLASAQAR